MVPVQMVDDVFAMPMPPLDVVDSIASSRASIISQCSSTASTPKHVMSSHIYSTELSRPPPASNKASAAGAGLQRRASASHVMFDMHASTQKKPISRNSSSTSYGSSHHTLTHSHSRPPRPPSHASFNSHDAVAAAAGRACQPPSSRSSPRLGSQHSMDHKHAACMPASTCKAESATARRMAYWKENVAGRSFKSKQASIDHGFAASGNPSLQAVPDSMTLNMRASCSILPSGSLGRRDMGIRSSLSAITARHDVCTTTDDSDVYSLTSEVTCTATRLPSLAERPTDTATGSTSCEDADHHREQSMAVHFLAAGLLMGSSFYKRAARSCSHLPLAPSGSSSGTVSGQNSKQNDVLRPIGLQPTVQPPVMSTSDIAAVVARLPKADPVQTSQEWVNSLPSPPMILPQITAPSLASTDPLPSPNTPPTPFPASALGSLPFPHTQDLPSPAHLLVCDSPILPEVPSTMPLVVELDTLPHQRQEEDSNATHKWLLNTPFASKPSCVHYVNSTQNSDRYRDDGTGAINESSECSHGIAAHLQLQAGQLPLGVAAVTEPLTDCTAPSDVLPVQQSEDMDTGQVLQSHLSHLQVTLGELQAQLQSIQEQVPVVASIAHGTDADGQLAVQQGADRSASASFCEPQSATQSTSTDVCGVCDVRETNHGGNPVSRSDILSEVCNPADHTHTDSLLTNTKSAENASQLPEVAGYDSSTYSQEPDQDGVVGVATSASNLSELVGSMGHAVMQCDTPLPTSDKNATTWTGTNSLLDDKGVPTVPLCNSLGLIDSLASNEAHVHTSAATAGSQDELHASGGSAVAGGAQLLVFDDWFGPSTCSHNQPGSQAVCSLLQASEVIPVLGPSCQPVSGYESLLGLWSDMWALGCKSKHHH